MTSKEDKIRTCTYSKLSGFGHTIYGLECLPAVNLPSGCFCASSPSPTPYLPLTDLLALVAKKGVNRTQVSVETKDFSSWHVDADNIHLAATFINDLNHSLHGLTPFTLSLTHNGKNSRPEGPSFSKNTQFFREIVMFFQKCHSFLFLIDRFSFDGKMIQNVGDFFPINIRSLTKHDFLTVFTKFYFVCAGKWDKTFWWILDTNPNYFSERDQSCGNVRLDYTVHKWESPSPASPSVATTNEDEKEDEHSFGLRPSQVKSFQVVLYRILSLKSNSTKS